MEKKLEDYIKYYIGCVVQTDTKQAQGEGKPFKLAIGCLVDYDIFGDALCGIVLQGEGEMELYAPRRIKLFLRPLSDMNTEEAIEVTKPVVVYGSLPNVRKYETWTNPFGKIVVSWGDGLREKYAPQTETSFTAEQFHYLIKQGFDLFGLIECGLAIDATKLKTGSIA
jgi:hypothetical protein